MHPRSAARPRWRVCLVALCAALAGAAAATPAAQAPGPPPFFFLQMSDPQFGMFRDDRDFQQETLNFELAIGTANRLGPAFVIVTGDLVNKPGDAAQIAEYRRIAGRLRPEIPLYAVAGNHDVENAPTPASLAAYQGVFGADRYTFSHHGLTGIVLNSSVIHTPDHVAGEFAARIAGCARRSAPPARQAPGTSSSSSIIPGFSPAPTNRTSTSTSRSCAGRRSSPCFASPASRTSSPATTIATRWPPTVG